MYNWQLKTPLSAIVFDCDGTLSAIEGIDELARLNGVAQQVKTLTEAAMGHVGMNPAIYQERLSLVLPSQAQLLALGELYFEKCVPDASAVIQTFQNLGKQVYLVSAGLYPAIKIFAEKLTLPSSNIFAVNITFDEQGDFLDFDHTSPLIHHDGKCTIVHELQKQNKNIGHIGDGLNDLVTRPIVTRFIGYGGVYYRANIAAQCDFYIRSLSLSPLLALCLTEAERAILSPAETALYKKGLELIQQKSD